MQRIIFLYLALFGINFFASGQGLFEGFFKPVELGVGAEGGASGTWKFRPTVNIPAFKITESVRPEAEVDVSMLTSVGGGLALQSLGTDQNGKTISKLSWSPITVLMSGNLTNSSNPIDLSVASTIGVFDDVIMFGGGYDLGAVEGRSRWFGLISIGINFNN